MERAVRLTLVAKDPESNLFDDQLVVFLHYAGNGLGTAKTTSTDPAEIDLCRSAFDAVWKLSVPHRDYQPV
jgi:uncharacterized protein DUF6879